MLSVLIPLLFLYLVSCENDEVAWVSINNETEYSIDIQFSPTSEANGYKLNETLDTIDTMVDIYHSGDESIAPCKLLSNGYNSFIIHINNSGEDILYFGKNEEPNYSSDPFTDRDAWSYEKFTDDFPTNFSPNTKTVHNYILNIRMENILSKPPK